MKETWKVEETVDRKLEFKLKLNLEGKHFSFSEILTFFTKFVSNCIKIHPHSRQWDENEVFSSDREDSMWKILRKNNLMTNKR